MFLKLRFLGGLILTPSSIIKSLYRRKEADLCDQSINLVVDNLIVRYTDCKVSVFRIDKSMLDAECRCLDIHLRTGKLKFPSFIHYEIDGCLDLSEDFSLGTIIDKIYSALENNSHFLQIAK